MDLSGKEKVGVESGDRGDLGYHQMDPFFPTFWDQNPNLQPAGFPESANVGGVLSGRAPLDTMPKGEALFLQPASGVPPPSLPHFQADSAFIERAARFSCFGGITSPFGLNHSVDPYTNITKNDTNVGEGLVDAMDAGNSHGYGGDQSGDAEISGQRENSNSKATKKRKRSPQSAETDPIKGESSNPKEAEKENADSAQKVGENNQIPEQNDTSNLKQKGKRERDSEDPPKADYIHVRARRGQATNSHSLAERVRREKISERMKFLQDLVPGCSKVTGKAVMLDEIINYVQSLQRQVEFLSMKLAAVNPHLELNIEGLLSKDVFQSHMVPSASIAFPPDLGLLSLQQNQQALIKPVTSGMAPLDAPKGATSTQMASVCTYGDSKLQIPNSWDGELHDTNQINLIGNPPVHIQDMNVETHGRFPT